MSGRPAFGSIKGAGKSSLRARDANEGGGGRGGGGKRLLNRGMTNNNGNYIGKRSEGGPGEEGGRAKVEDHALEAALGFGLFTDGADRLGWLMNMNTVSVLLPPRAAAPRLLRTSSASADLGDDSPPSHSSSPPCLLTHTRSRSATTRSPGRWCR
jgi:hypothetical protein